MNDNIEKLKFMCKSVGYTGNITDEYLFTVNCVDYYMYSKNIGAVDVKDGLVDGANDGGIDFIYSDADKLFLIQGKSTDSLTYNEIRDLFYKMRETFLNLKDKKYDNYNNRVVNSFINAYESFNETPEIEFILFTNTEFTEELRIKTNELNNNEDFEFCTVTYYGASEIQSKQLSIDSGSMTIDYGTLELDKPKNGLRYQEDKAAIFSIKASSLKLLYSRYKDSGLFGYNLREHIYEKKVDSEIDKTINEKPEEFWYLNNGITIGCSDFFDDGNKLKLYDFSIINGAQTTYKIGNAAKISEDYDFNIVCKVIKSEKSLEDSFIRRISEASNSQKPIKPRDLRANSYEQLLLQRNAADNGKYMLAIDIKRGVKPPKYKSIDASWQRVNNEVLGQLLWACDYQCPGSARSKKADIFGKDAIYNLIFSKDKIKNKYDYNTLYELVRLAKLYDDFKIVYEQKLEKDMAFTDNEIEKKEMNDRYITCQNSKFTVLALIMYFYKRRYLKIDRGDSRIKEHNLIGNLTLDYRENDYLEKLQYLFTFFIDKISNIYNQKQIAYKLTSQSNFLKSDSYYNDIIIPEFEKMYEDKYDSEKIIDNLVIFEKKI